MGLGYLHITAWSLLLNPVSWARPKALNSGASNDKDSRFSFCPNQSNYAISESMAVKASDPKYMEKLRMKSLDAVEGNVAKIAALFPHCVTERLNKDGKPELAIDFDKLRAELSADALDTGENAISSRGLISELLRVLPILRPTRRCARTWLLRWIFGTPKISTSRATISTC